MPTFAAIDIGSNSIRLKIARLKGSRLEPIHEDREVTRLGESVFKAGFLSPEAMAETIKVLRRFHRAAQRLAADVVRVVATSALRDARNSQAFLEWVRSATGWKVEIISGLEEARLIHLGLTSMGRVGASPVLMIDLGGGSCELTISKEGHIRDTVSLPLGAVRLTNEFLRHDPPRKSELKRLRGFVEREVSRVAGRVVAARVRVVVATSGTAAALAAVANHLQKNSGTRPAGSVSRPVMKRIAKLIYRLPIEQRRKLEGIGPRRAEIIAAGAQVYEELLELCHLHGFRYSPLGLRDGLLAQMAADSDPGTGPLKVLNPGDQQLVRKASLLLRLARALNLGRSRTVQKIRIQISDGAVRLRLLPRKRMGVDLELWAIEKDRGYFREVFGRELSAAEV